MSETCDASSPGHPELTWVESMGGPLIVVPVSALDRWGGCTEYGIIIGDTGMRDDYDRACDVPGLAGVISVGRSASGLVLANQPARTCYLPEENIFVRWLAAGSDAELLAAAKAVLNDPTTEWEDCGTWETDGAAVLMDSAEAGFRLGVEYPDGGFPAQTPVPVSAGRWRVRACDKTGKSPWVGIVQLVPAP